MKACCVTWGLVLLVCAAGAAGEASGKQWPAPQLERLGQVLGTEGRAFARKFLHPVANIAAAGIIICTGFSCDTVTTNNILTDLQTPETLSSAMQTNVTYYIIDDKAWPHTAVAISLDNGWLDLVEDDSFSIPMAALHDLAVLGHEAIGLEVSHLPPPDYDNHFLYIHYGKVTNFYSSGYLEVLIDSWSIHDRRNRKKDKQPLAHSYRILVDETVSVGMGGVSVVQESEAN